MSTIAAPGYILVCCSNRMCPEVLRTGKRQKVGELWPGARARLRCRTCHTIQEFHVPDEVRV